jgi:hypothetical protein
MPDPILYINRLTVDIKGPPVINLSEDIISIRFSESLARCNLLEVSVKNWTTDPSSNYKYSEGNLLHIGDSISLYSGDIILANGTISALAPNFTEDSAPTLMFIVDAKNPPKNMHKRMLRTTLNLTFGRELIEFHPVLRNTAYLFRTRINAIGTTVGLPDLRAGSIINIKGVGTTFSGAYSVTETTHTINDQSGYRTSFVARKLRHKLDDSTP